MFIFSEQRHREACLRPKITTYRFCRSEALHSPGSHLLVIFQSLWLFRSPLSDLFYFPEDSTLLVRDQERESLFYPSLATLILGFSFKPGLHWHHGIAWLLLNEGQMARRSNRGTSQIDTGNFLSLGLHWLLNSCHILSFWHIILLL